MKKFPLVAALLVIGGFGYVLLTSPDSLKPHNPHLTPSLTATHTLVPSETPTLLPSVTPSRTPVEPTIYPTLSPSSGTMTEEHYGISQKDREALARLCVIEVRGMRTVRYDACLSVISTVVTRAQTKIISDGTIAGTIGWGCTTESQACQFPAHVLDSGCEGLLSQACAYNYPEEIKYFGEVVLSFIYGDVGSCSGYIYYGITEQDPPECQIISPSGEFMNWHKKAN